MTTWNTDRDRFERALQTELQYDGGSGNGAVLLQKYIDRVVQFLTLREMGLLAVLDRRQGSGPAAYVNQRTAGTTLGVWVADDGTDTTANDGDFAQVAFNYKTLMTRGKVSRKLQAIGQSYIDILAMEMAGKAEDFASALEDGLIYGTLGVAAGAEPMGLVTLLENANATDATSSLEGPHIKCNCAGQTTTGNWEKSFPLSLANLDNAIDAVKGSSNRADLVIIGSFAGIRQVNAALQAQQRFINEIEIAAGFRVRTYDGIPLVVSSAIPDVMTWAGGGGSGDVGHIKAVTGGNGTQLLIINRRHTFISELTPTTVLPLAKTTSISDSFDMYWDGAPVLANNYGMSILSCIAADGVEPT